MAYDVTQLPAYTSQQSTVFIAKTILGTATIALLTTFGAFDPTAKGAEAIQLLDTDVVIQANDGCGRNPMGGAVLSQAVLTVREMKINQDYCTKDLVKTWAVEELKRKMKGLPYTDALFLEDIGNINVAKSQLKLEQMIWQGDTTSADTSLKLIDGFIKVIKAATHVNLNPANDADILVGDTVARLQKMDALMPIAVTMMDDYRVLIGQDLEKVYLAQLAAKNLFVPPGENMIFGTKAKYVSLPGLNGANFSWAGRVSRLRAGGEMTNTKFEKYYSPETKKTYFDSEFSLGVIPVNTTEMGIWAYTAP